MNASFAYVSVRPLSFPRRPMNANLVSSSNVPRHSLFVNIVASAGGWPLFGALSTTTAQATVRGSLEANFIEMT